MKTFSYRGFDQTGKSASGIVEALDAKEAREKLSSRGILAESVSPAGRRSGLRSLTSPKTTFTPEHRSVFYRELQALLKAGLPLSSALEILIDTPEHEGHQQLFAGIRDGIREGKSLSGALNDVSSLTAFEEALLEAGSESGTMDLVLDHLAAFLEDQKRIGDRVKSALIYPALVLVLALGIGVFILGFLLPRVEQMLIQSRMELPMLTKVMFGFGTWAGKLMIPVLLLVLAGGYYLKRAVQKNSALGEKKGRIMLQIPVVGRVNRALVKLRFSRTLALLLRGGVPMVEGLHLAGKSTGNSWVSTQVDQMAQRVRDGLALGQAVRDVTPLNEELPGWIAAGEASGDLPNLLENAADRFQLAWDRALTRFLAIFEPVLILIVGLFVFLVALSILLPLVQINAGLV